MGFTVLTLPNLMLYSATALAAITVTSRPSPSYCPKGCIDLDITFLVSNRTFVIPDQGDLTAPGAVDKFFNSIPSILQSNQTTVVSKDLTTSARYCPGKGKGHYKDLIQVLVHGATYDKEYWAGNVKNGYPGGKFSYLNTASEAGIATLSVDRMGNGKSSHPDPREVQITLEAEAIHTIFKTLRDKDSPLVCLLRGRRHPKPFKKVVYVGHSFGSQTATVLTKAYPDDPDGLILTGFSVDNSALPDTIATSGYAPAVQFRPSVYSGFPQGYLITTNESGREASFYYKPYFPPDVPHLDFESEGTISLGEPVSGSVPLPSSIPAYKGPVLFVTGDHDAIFCGPTMKCIPVDTSAVAKSKSLYPNAKSFDYIVPENTGHDINFHYSAPEVYEQIIQYTRKTFG